MNPSMIQAIAAQRSTELQEQAAAWRRAGGNGRSGLARRLWLSRPLPAVGRGAASRPVPRSLRGPQAA